jgi:hypothetical protein
MRWNKMKCTDAQAALEDAVNMREVQLSSSDLNQLVTSKLVARVKEPEKTASVGASLNSLRAQMGDIRAEKETLRLELQAKERSQTRKPPRKLYKKDPQYRKSRDRLEELGKQEKTLRTEMVDLAQASTGKRYNAGVNGSPFYVTYMGRELLGELDQRIQRVGEMDLKSFIAEMDTIKNHFQERSSRARKILKRISPKFPTTDEMHLRSVAVGLSSRSGEYQEASDLFIEAFEEISRTLGKNGAVYTTLAESLSIVARDKENLKELTGTATELILNSMPENFVMDDRVRAASIIMSSERDSEAMLAHTKSLSERSSPKNPSVAALLASQFGAGSGKVRRYADWVGAKDEEGGVFWKFVKINENLSSENGDELEIPMAAALLSSADLSIEDVTERYHVAMSMLRRFGVGDMEVPSAMIAILPVSVEESVDNLRMAAASIGTNRLSLGGVENLSLGMKLLMHTAAIPVGVDPGVKGAEPALPIRSSPVPSVLTIAGVSVAAAVALSAGILAFHEFSLHRRAVQDYAFHPVHFHYVYG